MCVPQMWLMVGPSSHQITTSRRRHCEHHFRLYFVATPFKRTTCIKRNDFFFLVRYVYLPRDTTKHTISSYNSIPVVNLWCFYGFPQISTTFAPTCARSKRQMLPSTRTRSIAIWLQGTWVGISLTRHNTIEFISLL